MLRSSDTCDVVAELSCHHDTRFHEINLDLGVIEANLSSEHVHPLHKHPGVSYVRPVLTYSDAV